MNSILEKAERGGGKIAKPAHDTFWGGYAGYFSDPDGYYWEVAHSSNWSFSNDGNVVFDSPAE